MKRATTTRTDVGYRMRRPIAAGSMVLLTAALAVGQDPIGSVSAGIPYLSQGAEVATHLPALPQPSPYGQPPAPGYRPEYEMTDVSRYAEEHGCI